MPDEPQSRPAPQPPTTPVRQGVVIPDVAKESRGADVFPAADAAAVQALMSAPGPFSPSVQPVIPAAQLSAAPTTPPPASSESD